MSPASRGAARIFGALGGAALAASALAACVELPAIGSGECGNGVIEPPEDCDGFGADSGAACLPRGAVGECHLSCSRADDGQSGCPDGWGCDVSGICRRPTGAFEAARELEVGTATALSSGDFDGDGHADLFSAERPNPYGLTRLKVHYFDDLGAPTDTRPFPHLLLSPSFDDMNGDGRRDLLFSDGNIGMLLGRGDRSMVPETFSSYRVPGSEIRVSGVLDQAVEQNPALVIIGQLGGALGLFVPDLASSGVPRLLATLASPVEAFAGEPVGGDVIEGAASPCREVVLAVRGESQLSMFDVCETGEAEAPTWRAQAAAQLVALEPPEPIEHGPQLVDVNGDGHLDVLVGSAARAYVAFGDGQALAPAVPLTLGAGAPDLAAPVPMPLAAGDVTGDGVVDFVYPEGFVLSSPSALTPGESVYEDVAFGGQGPFAVAAIADLNGNGLPDIIAASSLYPGLSFFNGTGSRDLTYFAVPTSRPAERLAVGDFDGDLVLDVAFTQRADGDAEEVLIAFGAPFAPPAAPVAVARLGVIDQLTTYTEAKLGNLVVSSTEGSGEQRQGAVALLAGSGDRLPMASYELTTFATDTSVNGAFAVRVVGGAFLSTAREDVLALAYAEPFSSTGVELWLLPELTRSAGSPVRLVGSLPPEARPLVADGQRFSVALAAADLDGDGRDEALIAAPDTDDEHCGLYTFRIERERAELLGQVAVAEPCALVELSALPAGAGRPVDVAWLSARSDGSEGRLSIFWNDGEGGLGSERRSVIGAPGAEPQAFALLPESPARRASLVVAAPAGLELWPLEEGALGRAEPLLELPGVTGLAAGDLNGDGAVDLAAAIRGNVLLMGAALETL